MPTNIPQVLSIVYEPRPRHTCPLYATSGLDTKGTIVKCGTCGQHWLFINGDEAWTKVSRLGAKLAIWRDKRYK